VNFFGEMSAAGPASALHQCMMAIGLMWFKQIGKQNNKGRPNRSIQDYDWKRSNIGKI